MTYYISVNDRAKSFIITFFKSEIFTLQMPVVIIALSVIVLQFYSGYIYNKLQNKTSETKGLKERIVSYILPRVSLLTYAVYELLAFYLLTLVLYGTVSTGVSETTYGISLLKLVLKVFLITLLTDIIFKVVVLQFLLKKLVDSWRIKKDTIDGHFVQDIQQQITNFAMILLSVLTFISIFGGEVDENEKTLFFALTTFVTSCYTFMIVKSKLYMLNLCF